MSPQENRSAAAWRGLVAVAAVIVVIAGMRAAADLIVPFLLALSIAIICLPPLAWLRRRNVPVSLSVTIVIVLIVMAIGGFGTLIANSIHSIIGDLPDYQQRFQGVLDKAMQFAHRMGWQGSLHSVFEQINPKNATPVLTQFFKGFGTLLGESILIVLTVIFLLFEASVLPGKLRTMPGDRHGHRSLEVFRSFVDSIQRYVFLKTIVSIVLGVLVALVLWGFGVRYPVLWGVLAFLLNFVPNVGAFLSSIPPILLALVQGGWPLAAYAGSTLFVIHFLTGNLVEPIIMGERLGLSVLVVWLSLIVWGWVLGPVGMLLSVPLTMILKIGFEAYPETRWVAVLLGPAPSSGNRLFEWLRPWRKRSARKQ
ncbi:MAG TPA: AI-2E family transporter [Gammaproteobacteria bacterium]|nr:AI-2E family transporter [Gammaproteobacteria bacterium]